MMLRSINVMYADGSRYDEIVSEAGTGHQGTLEDITSKLNYMAQWGEDLSIFEFEDGMPDSDMWHELTYFTPDRQICREPVADGWAIVESTNFAEIALYAFVDEPDD